MNGLVKFEAACKAVAAARAVDEVLAIRDQAEMLAAYGRLAKDRRILADAAEIKLRAERRLGQMMREQPKAKGATKAGTKRRGLRGVIKTPRSEITLGEAGIDKNLAKRARDAARPSDQEFEERIEDTREQIETVLDKAMTVVATTEEKQVKRAKREADIAAKIVALPQAHYGVILADPEWQFEPYSRDSGMDRAADNHYPTSPIEIIKARDVPSIAAADCVLFLWATAPMLPQALEVMAAWGFTYKTHAIWAKDRIGTGYWFRNKHEIILVGTSGKPVAPAMGTQPASVIEAPVGEHSAKPEVVLEMIERWYPTIPKIELNRRGPARPGWSAWGAEAMEAA